MSLRQSVFAGVLVALLALPALADESPSPPPAFGDEADQASLLAALARDRAYLAGLAADTSIPLAGRRVPVSLLRQSEARFEELVQSQWGTPGFDAALRSEFEALPMGRDTKDAVHFTGYHLPLLEAREHADNTFRFPIYAVPRDMLDVDLGAFRPELANQHAVGRLTGGQVVPYFDRAAIDDGHALGGRGLELAWVSDELARYQLMVQGSGLLHFADGHVANVNYASQNGRAYRSLGKTLIADGKLPAEGMSMAAIEGYFHAHPDELHATLGRNPSYVFFKLAPDGPFGCSGMSLVAGRAIATDKSLYGSGAIAWLSYPRPHFDGQGQLASWDVGGRFAVDADTGGAIRGADRVDVYWGGGDDAARLAGTLNGQGQLVYLLLKPTR